MLGNVHKFGMDPVEVAEKVVAAIKANRFYIFSHPEFKDELREVFDQILDEFHRRGGRPAAARLRAGPARALRRGAGDCSKGD